MQAVTLRTCTLCLVLMLAGAASPALAFSGRAAFVFSSLVKQLGLKPVTCPGKLGNPHTRCAVTLASKAQVQKAASQWKGWKQTDPWQEGSAAFTSNGQDGYAVSALDRIGAKGALFILSEF